MWQVVQIPVKAGLSATAFGGYGLDRDLHHLPSWPPRERRQVLETAAISIWNVEEAPRRCVAQLSMQPSSDALSSLRAAGAKTDHLDRCFGQ